jgi:hypothetical protein
MSHFTKLSGVDRRLARHTAMMESIRQVYGGEVIKSRYSEQEEQTIARLALTTTLPTDANHTEEQIVQQLVNALRDVKDPEFILRAAQVSRKANFKLFPKVAAAALLANRTSIEGWNPIEIQLAHLLGSYPPGQLLELVLMVKGKLFGKGLGTFEQRFFARIMQTWNLDRLEGFTLDSAGDLQRLMRLVHPNLNQMSTFVLDGRPAISARQTAASMLRSATSPEDLIRDFRLPFNFTKGAIPNSNTAAWEAIREGMGPLQLLLNLRALDEKGVMNPKLLAELLAEAENSRLLPVDVLRPIINAPQPYQETLISLLSRMAPVPLPGLENLEIAVLIDGSGSMTWTTMTGTNQGCVEAGKPTNWQRALVMAAPLLALPNRHYMIFDSNPRPEGHQAYAHRGTGMTPYLKGCPKEAILHNLLNACPAGSTNTGAAIHHYTQTKTRVDVMFVITDENQNGSLTALEAFRRYQSAVNPEAKLVIINCTTTAWHMAPEGTKDVKIIQSITPLIYQMLESYDQSSVELIRTWPFGGIRD